MSLNTDLEMALERGEMMLEVAGAGGVQVRTRRVCPECKGQGLVRVAVWWWSSRKRCGVCNGRGYVEAWEARAVLAPPPRTTYLNAVAGEDISVGSAVYYDADTDTLVTAPVPAPKSRTLKVAVKLEGAEEMKASLGTLKVDLSEVAELAKKASATVKKLAKKKKAKKKAAKRKAR